MQRALALGLVVLAAVLTWGLAGGMPAIAGEPAVAPVPLRQPTGANLVARDFSTSDSLTLLASQALARSRGTLVLLHGLGPHEPIAERLAPALAQRLGYHVIVFPLRSAGVRDARIGDVDGADAYLRDVAAITRELKRRIPSGPIVLVGTGVGGALAVRYAEGHARVDGPAVDALVLDRPALTRDALFDDAAGLPPDLVWHSRRAKSLTWLSRVRLSMLERLPVAYAPIATPTGTLAQPWTMRAFTTMLPHDAWRTLRNAPEAVLFLSPRSPAPEWYRRTDKHEWAASDTAGVQAPRVLDVMADFLSQFAEAAAERTPIPPTQPLPVIQRD